MTSGLVDVVSACLELSTRTQGSLSSADVRTSFWKECSLGAFVRDAGRRDLAHNLPEVHEVRVDNWVDP